MNNELLAASIIAAAVISNNILLAALTEDLNSEEDIENAVAIFATSQANKINKMLLKNTSLFERPPL